MACLDELPGSTACVRSSEDALHEFGCCVRALTPAYLLGAVFLRATPAQIRAVLQLDSCLTILYLLLPTWRVVMSRRRIRLLAPLRAEHSLRYANKSLSTGTPRSGIHRGGIKSMLYIETGIGKSLNSTYPSALVQGTIDLCTIITYKNSLKFNVRPAVDSGLKASIMQMLRS